MPDSATLGPFTLLRGFVYPDSALPLLDFAHAGLFLFVHGMAWLDSLLPALDFALFGLSSSSRGHARCGLAMFVVEFLHLEPALFSQGSA